MYGGGQMAQSGVSQDDLYAFMMTAGAAERVARYRQEAEKFRKLAQTENDGSLREELLSLAKQYDALADGLTPRDTG
jgi:hypothetical protein